VRPPPGSQELGVPILGASDHTISHSLYLRDPDGNDVELFIDVAGVDWKADPSLIAAPVKPLPSDGVQP
jgi:catechol 2,3-dioxygenase